KIASCLILSTVWQIHFFSRLRTNNFLGWSKLLPILKLVLLSCTRTHFDIFASPAQPVIDQIMTEFNKPLSTTQLMHHIPLLQRSLLLASKEADEVTYNFLREHGAIATVRDLQTKK